MPTALLPDGRVTYVQDKLDVSVSFPDSKTRVNVQRAIREALAEDPRRLFVRVQGGGGYGPWCFWIQWGVGQNCRSTPAIILNENEHEPQAVLTRIKAALSNLSQDSN
jgi:hypothetical protein